jgi:probable addiction module antidote protein
MSRARKKAGSKARAVRVTTFDPAEFLDSEAVIAEYLSAAIEDPNPDVFLRAMANVARARGIGEIAKASGLGRESLYKALAPGAKVRYETVRKVLDSLGVRLKVAA